MDIAFSINLTLYYTNLLQLAAEGSHSNHCICCYHVYI